MFHNWLRVKNQATEIEENLNKGFTQEDTAIQATYISRKLDALENLVKERGQEHKKTLADMKNEEINRDSQQSSYGGPGSFKNRHQSFALDASDDCAFEEAKAKILITDPSASPGFKVLRNKTVKRRWKRCARKVADSTKSGDFEAYF